MRSRSQIILGTTKALYVAYSEELTRIISLHDTQQGQPLPKCPPFSGIIKAA